MGGEGIDPPYEGVFLKIHVIAVTLQKRKKSITVRFGMISIRMQLLPNSCTL